MILIVDTLNVPKHGTILEFWKVGSKEPEYIQRPFNPFFYSFQPPGTSVEKIILATHEKKAV